MNTPAGHWSNNSPMNLYARKSLPTATCQPQTIFINLLNTMYFYALLWLPDAGYLTYTMAYEISMPVKIKSLSAKQAPGEKAAGT